MRPLIPSDVALSEFFCSVVFSIRHMATMALSCRIICPEERKNKKHKNVQTTQGRKKNDKIWKPLTTNALNKTEGTINSTTLTKFSFSPSLFQKKKKKNSKK